MGCCGQKRANFTAPISQSTARPITQPAPERQIAAAPAIAPTAAYYSGSPAISLHYLESSPIRVKGNVTGRYYEFSRANPDQAIDVRDAEALLHTRFFRRNR